MSQSQCRAEKDFEMSPQMRVGPGLGSVPSGPQVDFHKVVSVCTHFLPGILGDPSRILSGESPFFRRV